MKLVKYTISVLAIFLIFSSSAQSRRVIDPSQRLKSHLTSLELVRFALPRSDIDNAKREITGNPASLNALADRISSGNIAESLEITQAEKELLVEILRNYDSYSSSDIERLTGYRKQVFPALLYLWIENGPFYKGKAILFYSNHADRSDFEAIKPGIEQNIQEAQERGFKVLFILENAGPDLRLTVLYARHLGVSLETFVNSAQYQRELISFFQESQSALYSLYSSVENGVLSPDYKAGTSTNQDFDQPLLELLASYRVKTIPEQISFEAWKKYVLANYHNIEFQGALLEGDLGKARYHFEQYTRLETEAIKARDIDLMNFLESNLRPSTVILTDRGIIHSSNIENQDTAAYTIEGLLAYETSFSPVRELIIGRIKGEAIYESEEEIAFYKEILHHFAYLFLLNMHPEFPSLRMLGAAKEISDKWDKDEALGLLNILKQYSLAQGFAYIGVKVIQDESLSSETRSLFTPPD